MIRSRYVILVLVVKIGTAAKGILHAQKEKEQFEGSAPYTPTKLEWVTLLANIEQENDGEIHTSFRPHPDKANTIQVQVFHSAGVDKSLVEAHVELARRTVTRVSQRFEWDWAQVEVHAVELISSLSN